MEDVIDPFNEHCAVIEETVQSKRYTIFLDLVIDSPALYRKALYALQTATEADDVFININNCGGMLDTAIPIINAIKNCEGTVYGVLQRNAYSAASMILLACPNVVVEPYADMMCHGASFGTEGTVKNVIDYATHIKKTTERVTRDVYQHFLSESEIQRVLNNEEIWLDDEQIVERLRHRNKMLEQEGMGDVGCDGGDEYAMSPI